MEKHQLLSLDLDSNWSKKVDELFESEDWALFRTWVAKSYLYAEWGSGLSTFYAAGQNQVRRVLTVETDPEWAAKVSSAVVMNSEKIEVRQVDFGAVGRWGRPQSYSGIENVWNYSGAPFKVDYRADLLLVDGRFRVHCFLSALLHARRGTRIIFDDYFVRPHYHIVEKFIKPVDTSGRQALFEVGTRLFDRHDIKKLSRKFSYVMD